MTTKDISKARDPLLRKSLDAMHEAALLARRDAIASDTGIAIVRNGERVLISATELRAQSVSRPAPAR